MFQHIHIQGPTRFTEDSKKAFLSFAHMVTYDRAIPLDDQDLVYRVGTADALLVSMEVQVGDSAMRACPALRYIGMCCSLYGPESANVDIHAANQRGITVTGIRDYGDHGVVEYVISELVALLHGFHTHMWRPEPIELTDMRCGILGMGGLGRKICDALRYFGADISYFSRTRKPDIENEGIPYLPLRDLLAASDAVIACLNRNAILLHQEEFEAFGNGKILINISIGPCSDTGALANWLQDASNFFLCDTPAPLGDARLLSRPNVICAKRGAGLSVQSNARYNEKILANIRGYLEGETSCVS